jgi:hypothetical protein
MAFGGLGLRAAAVPCMGRSLRAKNVTRLTLAAVCDWTCAVRTDEIKRRFKMLGSLKKQSPQLTILVMIVATALMCMPSSTEAQGPNQQEYGQVASTDRASSVIWTDEHETGRTPTRLTCQFDTEAVAEPEFSLLSFYDYGPHREICPPTQNAAAYNCNDLFSACIEFCRPRAPYFNCDPYKCVCF